MGQRKKIFVLSFSELFSSPIKLKANSELMGATDPKKAKDGTIRKLYGISIDKNSVHGSDSLENAKSEIKFFFNK